jgi:hypothetical protein
MTWHPITEKPETVGRYTYASECHSVEILAQWDGRQWRTEDGKAIVPFGGDLWRKEESNVLG